MRPIDADDLIRSVHDEWDECLVWDESGESTANEMERIINNKLTIDLVKHGKWIKMSDADGVYWACSECGENIPRISHYNPQFDLFPRLESIDKTNYCPHCGAKMDLK